MATAISPAQLTPELISQAARAMSESELRNLEGFLRDERLRRLAPDVPDDIEALRAATSEPLPHGERWAQLQQLRADESWDESLQAELLELNEAREAANVRRVAAAMRLAKLQDVPFQTLWKQLVGEAQTSRLVTD